MKKVKEAFHEMFYNQTWIAKIIYISKMKEDEESKEDSEGPESEEEEQDSV